MTQTLRVPFPFSPRIECVGRSKRIQTLRKCVGIVTDYSDVYPAARRQRDIDDSSLPRWEAAPQEPSARKRKRAALLMVRPRAREEQPWDAAGPVRRFLSPFRAPFDKRVDCRR
ncbi:hypothetical protein HPB50_021960 [Hyalomma asiaticum]|uniref:Uncharacterized protein n=1 Tax=Hyalomma asiaticum TaxID=266040 RepID=A0ACB7TLU6_HYAAI|nr:hypothetical protein HPB50_021960 [Hyalomma asiaticum]